jgi:hypothetical protein
MNVGANNVMQTNGNVHHIAITVILISRSCIVSSCFSSTRTTDETSILFRANSMPEIVCGGIRFISG